MCEWILCHATAVPDAVQGSLEQILAHCSNLHERVDLIQSLRAEPSWQSQTILQWCSRQKSRALESLNAPTGKDVPILIQTILEEGILFAATL
jgi:hypothetical protein